MKPYAACRATHAMVDMARSFRERHGLQHVAQIERIDICVSPEVYNLVGTRTEVKLKPESAAAAQFSAYFVTVQALLHGRMGLSDSTSLRRYDPQILELAAKAHLHSDPGCRADRSSGRTDMTIHTAEGNVVDQSSDCPLGAPENPVSMDMLRAKLLDCVAHGGHDIAARDIDGFIEQVENIEQVSLARAV